jgi:hypothetical protein
MSRRHIAGLFHAAYTRTTTHEKAKNTFTATGIYPQSQTSYPVKTVNQMRPSAEIRDLMRIWKRLKISIQMLTLPFLYMILISAYLPQNKTPCNIYMETALTPKPTPHTNTKLVIPLPILLADDPGLPIPASP